MYLGRQTFSGKGTTFNVFLSGLCRGGWELFVRLLLVEASSGSSRAFRLLSVCTSEAHSISHGRRVYSLWPWVSSEWQLARLPITDSVLWSAERAFVMLAAKRAGRRRFLTQSHAHSKEHRWQILELSGNTISHSNLQVSRSLRQTLVRSSRLFSMSLSEVWEAASSNPFNPTISKDSQFLVGSSLLILGLVPRSY